MNNPEAQQKYAELQMLSQQLQQLQQQIEMLTQQVADMGNVKESLDSVAKSKEDSEVYTPLGIGIFIKTKLNSNSEVLMNVGGNVALPKSISDAKDLVEKQIEEIKGIVEHMKEEFAKGTGQVQHMQMELQQTMAAAKESAKDK
jgi:prefoldin alpha subunit